MTTLPAKDCVILVPCGDTIATACEQSLRVLEQRGYTVRRVRGYAAIDMARNVIASAAIRDGFAETLWIDSDIGFDPDSIEQLRSHNLPIVSGLYAKKGRRQFASNFLPGTQNVLLGAGGGLMEILYAATGFLLVQRQVYLDIQQKLNLPDCNAMFGDAVVPWFQPMIREYQTGHWYLGEDFAFCERARQAGFDIYADTSIRLWHFGNYAFGWEEAGNDVMRFATFNFQINEGGVP